MTLTNANQQRPSLQSSSTEGDSAMGSSSDASPMLTLREAAKQIRCCYKTALELVSDKRHQSQRLKSKRIGRSYRIHRDWVTEFLNK